MTAPPSTHPKDATLSVMTVSGENHTLDASTIGSNGTLISTAIPHTNTSDISSGTTTPSNATAIAIAIAISLLVIVIAAIALFVVLKKMGRLPRWFYTHRKRRSSTSSSRRALEEEEEAADTDSEHRPNEKLKKTTAEMFTIEDFEEEGEDKEREEYFYDEVFGQSQFEDETTKNSVRQLYARNSSTSANSHRHDNGNDNEEEMLDFDFETLGIKPDEYSLEVGRNISV